MATSVADSTLDACGRAPGGLNAWLDGAAPTDAAIASYLPHLFESGAAPATAAQVVVAVKFRAKLDGKAPPLRRPVRPSNPR